MASATKAGSLTGMLQGAAAIGDLATMWDDIAKVAPTDIQTDAERTRDAWNTIQNDAGEKKVLAAATTALANASSIQRVNDYIGKHCGATYAPVLSGASPMPTPSASASAPAGPSVLQVNRGASNTWDYGPKGVITADSPNGDTLAFTTVESTNSVAAAHNGTVDAPGLTDTNGDGNVVRWAVGAEQLPDVPGDFAVATKTHTAASGLTPESGQLRVAAVDADASGAAASVPVSFCDTDSCGVSMITRFGDDAVLAYGIRNDAVSAVDLATGKTLWTKTNVTPVAVSGDLMVFETAADQAPHPVFAVDVHTGTTAWTYHDADGRQARAFGASIGGSYATVFTEESVSTTLLERENIVDLRTGRTVTWRYGDLRSGSVSYDPVGDQFVLAGLYAGRAAALSGSTDLEVLNESGTKTFSITAAQYEKLGSPGVLGAYDGRAWLDTSDGVDLIDLATGSQDPASPKLTGSSDAPIYVGSSGAVTIFTVGKSSMTKAVVTPDGQLTFDALQSASG